MSYHADIERRAKERVGTTLRGKYRLDKLLGMGGMAVVYAATHKNRNRVAVKLLHAELAINSDIRGRFLREGYVANTVDHPGAVRILDDDEVDDGSVFLVMELLEGETLDHRIDRSGGKLGPLDIAAIAVDVCDVLAAAHGKKIVHRDIKPENTFVMKTGQVKILDFGIARLREGDGAESSTQTGQTVGTPAFMAPEQALGDAERINPTSDVWSVGATIFYALTGEYVHNGKTQAEMLVLAASKHARPLLEVDSTIPQEIAAVVDKALSFDPADRFADGGVMRDALRVAIAQLSPSGHRISLVDIGEAAPIQSAAVRRKTAFDTTQLGPSQPSVEVPVTDPPFSDPTSTTGGVSSGKLVAVVPLNRSRNVVAIAIAVAAVAFVISVFAFRARDRAKEPITATTVETRRTPIEPIASATPTSQPTWAEPPQPSAAPTSSVTPAASHAPIVRPKPSVTGPASATAPTPHPTVDPLDRQ